MKATIYEIGERRIRAKMENGFFVNIPKTKELKSLKYGDPIILSENGIAIDQCPTENPMKNEVLNLLEDF